MGAMLESFQRAFALRAAGHAGSLQHLLQLVDQEQPDGSSTADSDGKPTATSALAPAVALTALPIVASIPSTAASAVSSQPRPSTLPTATGRGEREGENRPHGLCLSAHVGLHVSRGSAIQWQG